MYQKTKLKNGLRVLTVPVKNTKTVTTLLLVGAGSKYEARENNGVSHFLEHMFFKGTKKRPDTLKLIEPLDKVGGSYNAFTSQEFTGYWAKLASRHLDIAMDWISDIYLNSKFEQAEINRERGTILQELNMYLDTPMRYVSDLWTSLLYGDQPAGWRIIGQEKVIKKIKRQDFISYLKSHYSSQNTIIVVAGAVEHQEIVKKVNSYFKEMNTLPVKDKLAVQEKQTRPQVLVHYKKTDQTHLHLGWRGYHLFHPDKYALGLLAIILGGNMSSRMFISVRERQGLAYYIGTSADLDTDTGSLFTKAGVDNLKAEKAIATILKEYTKIKKSKVSPAELKKAKEYVKGTALISMESSDEQASYYGFQELLTDRILTLEEKFAKIDAVSVDDIQRVAQDLFQPKNLNLALIGPFKDKKKFEKLLST